MSPHDPISRPVRVHHARYRWDELRRHHQVVFPEGEQRGGVIPCGESRRPLCRLPESIAP
jgi:hypothetical protein